MEQKKRRGCPPGGWPSQRAKKGLAPNIVAINEPVGNRPPTYAFTIEQEKQGENLFRVVMLTIRDGLISETHFMSAADFKRNTMHKVLYCLTQIYCNDCVPEALDTLPMQAHG